MRQSIHLFLSDVLLLHFPALCFWCYDGHSFARQLEKRDANRKRVRLQSYFILFRSRKSRRTTRNDGLRVPFYVFSNAPVKERLLCVATARSDLFYWDVGTSDQFTKCPVKHGGPIIISMIRTSFRPPIYAIRELFKPLFVTFTTASKLCEFYPIYLFFSSSSIIMKQKSYIFLYIYIANDIICLHII